MAIEWNETDFRNLYSTSKFMSNKNKKTLGLFMPVQVYVQDPSVAKEDARAALNTIYVTREPDLMDGPTSARVAVVDYDAETDLLEEPARWFGKEGCFKFKHNGKQTKLTNEHCDKPQFHQVHVWAIVQSILDMYEATWVLGRSAPWAFEGNRLIVVPHAGNLRNAYYDRHSKSIQLYYFGSKKERIYTCLSHDIIAHETGHAILDGLRPYYIQDTSLQTTAFHEFVADMTAILGALLNSEVRWLFAEGKDFISGLAEEFGKYTSNRPHLRSATNPDANSIAKVKDSINPYLWSQLLTGAMWEIFLEITKLRKKTPRSDGREYSPKQAVLWAANAFRRLAFQPLDYLPPVDVQFGDYVRAVLRADEVAFPVDEYDYRGLMRRVFKKRGIVPDEDEIEITEQIHFYGYDIEQISRSRTDAYHFLNQNRRQLCIPHEQDLSVVDLYQTDKTLGYEEGKLHKELVVQYVWYEDVELNGPQFGPLNGKATSLFCGGTLVLDERGHVLSLIRKPGTGEQESDSRRRRKYCKYEREKGEQRRKELLEYVASRIGRGYIGLYEGDKIGEIDVRPPVIAEQARDGTLRLEVTPYLRHWSEDVEKNGR